MATKRTAMTPQGRVITFNENRTAMTPSGAVVSEQLIAAASGGTLLESTNYQGMNRMNGGMRS